ncbi:MAG: hypothetical protein ACXAAH_17155 [Promethearchaeota archaeon]|jgi:hypothetical protein
MRDKHKSSGTYFSKRIINGCIYASGSVIIIGIIIILYIWLTPRRGLIRPTIDRPWIYRYRYEIASTKFLIMSMIIPSIVSILILTPVSFILNKHLKNLQAIYIKHEYEYNKDFVIYQRTSHKPVQPPKY